MQRFLIEVQNNSADEIGKDIKYNLMKNRRLFYVNNTNEK